MGPALVCISEEIHFQWKLSVENIVNSYHKLGAFWSLYNQSSRITGARTSEVPLTFQING